MNENKWVNSLSAVAENPHVYTDTQEQIVADDVEKICDEVLEDIDTAFKTFEMDMVFGPLIKNLQGILSEFNEALGGKFDSSDLLAEAKIQIIYSAIAEYTNTAQAKQLITVEEAELIRSELTIFDRGVSRENYRSENQPNAIISEDEVQKRASEEIQRRHFISSMKSQITRMRSVIEDYRNGYLDGSTQQLTNEFNTVTQQIGLEWDDLQDEELKSQCYVEFEETYGDMAKMIEVLLQSQEIDDVVFSNLRDALNNIYEPRKLISYENIPEESINSETVERLTLRSEQLPHHIKQYLEEYERARLQGNEYPIIQNIKNNFNEIFEIWKTLDKTDRVTNIAIVVDAMIATINAYQTLRNNIDIDPKEYVDLEHLVEVAAHRLKHDVDSQGLDSE